MRVRGRYLQLVTSLVIVIGAGFLPGYQSSNHIA